MQRIAQLERIEQEKRELERQLAEYKRQQKYQATQSSRSSLIDSFAGAFVDGLFKGMGAAASAKINRELGIKTAEERHLDEFKRFVREENDRMHRKMRKTVRMQQIMNNLKVHRG